MELKPGYKQTAVGVIPEGWDVALVSSLLALPIQNGVFNEPSRKGRGCKLINVIDLYGSFPIDTKDLERFDANRDEFLRFGVKHGDMFFTRSSLTLDGIAKCNVYRGDGNEDVVFDCHIIRVRPNSRKAEPFYLARYCNSRPARSYLVANAKTTTMTTIDQSVVAKLPVALPPLPEQRAIATALSDVDGLLGGLDRLFAKKRDLKQAAMQQLLTGQTRLPGFQGEWEETTLGQMGECIIGLTYKPENVVEHGLLVLRSSNVQEGRLAYDDNVYVNLQVSVHLYTRLGDILVCVRNGSRALIGKCAVIDSTAVGVTFGAFMSVYRTKHWRYVFHAFQADDIQRQIRDNIGATINQITNKDMDAFRLRLPPEAEQTAIAEVLTEMDAELAVLEQRREKTRALKQAMMHSLLTGLIRLV